MSKVFNVSFLHAKGKNQIRDGLMYRKKKLKKNQGMLFHTGLKVSSFWMKNTFIPLDVLFLNKNGKIIGYKEKNKPHSLKAISIGKRSFYVLEMNAGWVKNNKVKVGDKIKIRNRKKTRKKRGGNDVCTICQGQLPGVSTRNNSSTFTLKDCTHKYHKVCLIQWISTSIRNRRAPAPTCPVCRSPIQTNDFPEGINTEVQRGTFNTNDGFNMNTLTVIVSSIDYASGHGVLSPRIRESTPRERSLYFQLIRTVVQLGTGDVPFTAQNVLVIYQNIMAIYNDPRNGLPSLRTNFYNAINEDIGRLEAWIQLH
ncbi:MAG: DUF192 domain-containing protein [Pelagibacterales bacterium]|nr:DUF192 domain-containing protein [Pelagibacterales bacterium]